MAKDLAMTVELDQSSKDAFSHIEVRKYTNALEKAHSSIIFRKILSILLSGYLVVFIFIASQGIGEIVDIFLLAALGFGFAVVAVGLVQELRRKDRTEVALRWWLEGRGVQQMLDKLEKNEDVDSDSHETKEWIKHVLKKYPNLTLP